MPGRSRFVLLGAAFVLGFCARKVSAQCPGGLTFTYTGNNFATVGVAYSAVIDTHGATTGAVIVSSATNLPPGLTYREDHQDVDILGTPTRGGIYDALVSILEPATGRCGTAAFRIIVGGGVSAIAIAPSVLSDGVVGVAYGQHLTASGGTGAYTFSALGALPPGLSLSSDGTISGTPTAAGDFSFGAAVSAATSGTGRADYTVVITATPTPRLVVAMGDGGAPWGHATQIEYTGTVSNVGTATAAAAVVTLVLDGGLSFDCDRASPTGLRATVPILLGDIPAGSTFPFSLTQSICAQAITDVVGSNPLALQTYQIVSEASASSIGASSNTVAVVTPFCNSAPCATFCPLRYLSGYPCAQILLSPSAAVLPAVAGVAYSQTITAASGAAPYQFSARDLPPGLSMDSVTGTISGTVAQPGRFEITVGVEDASGCHAEDSHVIEVCTSDGSPALNPQSTVAGLSYDLPPAVRERDYRTDLTVSCGTPPFQIDSPSGLPAGLEAFLFASGSPEPGLVVRGKPADAGDLTFTLRVTDSQGKSGTASYRLHVGTCVLEAGPDEFPPATVGVSYISPQIQITGGTPPYEFVDTVPHCELECSIFTMPSTPKLDAIYDIDVSSDGSLRGFPQQAGHPSFTVFFKDSSAPPCFGSKTFTLDILDAPATCPHIDVAPEDLPAATVGVAYSVPLSASGGSGAYRYGSDGLAPDSGLTVDSTGFVVGTPSREGILDFDVFAQDEHVCLGSRVYSVSVAPNPNCQPIYVSPWTLAPGTAGVPYAGTAVPSDRIQASGGVRPYRLALATMPPGLGLSLDPSTGELTGTPSQAATYAFTVTATDSNPAGACSGSFRYTIEIRPGILSSASPLRANVDRGRAGGFVVDAVRGAIRGIRAAVEAFAAVRTVLRDLSLYYRIRDGVLAGTPGGRELTRLYYRHSPEITAAMASDSTLRDLALAAVSAWEASLRSLDAGLGAQALFTPAMSSSMNALLARLRQTGSPSLAADIAAQQASFDFASWVGLSMDQARSKLDARPCVASDSALCLNGGRFRAEVAWHDFSGNAGSGHAVALTADTGYFWFFTASNVELVIKALDGRALNGHFWIFYGALSNVEYTLTVTDTTTGEIKTYSNPSGHFGSVGDTSAFASTASAGGSAERSPQRGAVTRPPAATACSSDATSLCLNAGRFRANVAWKDFAGNTGVGTAVPLTADTGYFWFFTASNVELIVKALDGRAFNDRYWLFYGALSDVEYTLTITDTVTGMVKTYSNPSGQFGSVGDTSAFPGN